MKLAFSGQGHYSSFDDGYALYMKRDKSGAPLDKKTYKRIIRSYCKILAQRLLEDGVVDLPSRFGRIAAVRITKKPQYRGQRFVGYGAMDWKKGVYDGKLKTFGITYIPRRDRSQNMRCLGFVANRQLFKRVKSFFNEGSCGWDLMDFNEEMV